MNTLLLNKLYEQIREKDILKDAISAMMILDEDLHISFANGQVFPPEMQPCPGDYMHCVNSIATNGKCGTHEYCGLCKLRRTVTQSLKEDRKIGADIVLLLEGNKELCAQIFSTPCVIEGRKFAIVIMLDTTMKHREMMMERIFFHDILNLAGALNNCIDCIDYDKNDAMMGLLNNISRQLIDEIMAHRDLIYAEKGMLQSNPAPVSVQQVINYTTETVRPMVERMEKQLEVVSNITDEEITTDRNLLHRVLLNMIKNAGESTTANRTVTLRVKATDKSIIFTVHNSGVIPAEVQANIFRQGNSTKGSGRGLGTYSMKLLGENLLKGKVWFTSTEETGTEFNLSIPRR